MSANLYSLYYTVHTPTNFSEKVRSDGELKRIGDFVKQLYSCKAIGAQHSPVERLRHKPRHIGVPGLSIFNPTRLLLACPLARPSRCRVNVSDSTAGRSERL